MKMCVLFCENHNMKGLSKHGWGSSLFSTSAVVAARSSEDTDEADTEVEFVDCPSEVRSFQAEGVAHLQVQYL